MFSSEFSPTKLQVDSNAIEADLLSAVDKTIDEEILKNSEPGLIKLLGLINKQRLGSDQSKLEKLKESIGISIAKILVAKASEIISMSPGKLN